MMPGSYFGNDDGHAALFGVTPPTTDLVTLVGRFKSVSGNTNRNTLANLGNSTSGEDDTYVFSEHTDGNRFRVRYRDEGSSTVTWESDDAVPVNEWYDWVAQFSFADGSVSVWVNNEAQADASFSAGDVPDRTLLNRWGVGVLARDDFANPFSGNICDVAVFYGTISAADRTAFHTEGRRPSAFASAPGLYVPLTEDVGDLSDGSIDLQNAGSQGGSMTERPSSATFDYDDGDAPALILNPPAAAGGGWRDRAFRGRSR